MKNYPIGCFFRTFLDFVGESEMGAKKIHPRNPQLEPKMPPSKTSW